jgi:acyl-CoA synthetase (AMP-forming)/AMP-acid ligase II
MTPGHAELAGWSERVYDGLHRNPDAPAILALSDNGFQTCTGAELAAMATHSAAVLDEYAVPDGEYVPALLTTRPASVGMLLAAAFTGRPLAPLGPKMTERELLACLHNLHGRLLVTEAEFATKAARLAAATGLRVVVIDDATTTAVPWRARPSPAHAAFMMHTSGTTGIPKQVVVDDAKLARRADVNGALLGLSRGARLVIAGLFHHVGGLGNIAVALANETTVVLYPSFSVRNWRQLEALSPTHVITVPSVIEMLLAADALALPTLRMLGYGGAPMHPDTMRRIQLELPDVDCVELFGQTEGSPLTVLTAEDHRAAITGREGLLSSVGRPVPGAELRIHGAEAGGIGEVWVRCGHSFVVDDDGWQHTGDLGYLEDGYLYLAGRRADKIIRGGENVFPVEVEQVLESHPGVAEAAVIGVPDQRLGETIRAYLVPTNASNAPDLDEIRGFCRERLAGFKVPAQWRWAESLPRNAVGKLVRRELGSDNQ